MALSSLSSLSSLLSSLSGLLTRIFFRRSFSASSLQSLGMSNADVWKFQAVLAQRGRRYGVKVQQTGVYDEQTRDAVTAYQTYTMPFLASHDGFVGPMTARRLGFRLRED